MYGFSNPGEPCVACNGQGWHVCTFIPGKPYKRTCPACEGSGITLAD